MGKCTKCLLRVPYATLVATVLCCAGVGVFITTLYRIVRISAGKLRLVFSLQFEWLENVRTGFIAVGICMAVVSLLQLVVGILATGSTRAKVYRGWRSRLGGRISCAVFMALTYLLQLAWLGIVICMTVMIFVLCMLKEMCNRTGTTEDGQIRNVDLRQFDFLFPDADNLELNEVNTQRLCNNVVKHCIVLAWLSFGSSIVVVISLIHYLMALSANYARIKDHEKLKDLQELQYLQDTISRDRF